MDEEKEKEMKDLCREIQAENCDVVVRKINKSVFTIYDDRDGKEAYFRGVEILSSGNIKFSLKLKLYNGYTGIPSPTIIRDEVLPKELFIKLAAYAIVSYGSIFKILLKVGAMNKVFN
jgi:hypothetical protein